VLRIELLDGNNGTTTLELAGRVVGPWVDELSRSCESVLAIGGTLSVDLGQVSFVDRDGVEFLKRLRARNVTLVNCTPFVAEQLKSQG
jgi:anti-anti-sigma regulatory factor